MKIIVHGGAWDIPKEYHQAHLKGVEAAALKGSLALNEGKSAVEVCLEAVTALENDPTFDAGKGSFLNAEGKVEMDAFLMDGKDLSIGSVVAVQSVKNPILLANEIRTQTEHCVLAGSGAEAFAKKQGLSIVTTEELLVGRELELYKSFQEKGHIHARTFFDKPSKMGTVGAVAIDKNGNIACATSTGGTPDKMPGRVGDSPLPGAGGYANGWAGASTTGWGESIMKTLLAKSAVDAVAMRRTAQQSTDFGIDQLGEQVNGLGGVILIDHKGDHSFSYNTPFMARAVADECGIIEIGI